MLQGMLKKGTKLSGLNGITYSVKEMLGSGGQGEVYKIDSPSGEKALKWYYKQSASSMQKCIISDLVNNGSPSGSFLWPLDLINGTDGTFGYVMELRPKEYKSISDLLNRKTDPSFEKLILAIFNLARAFEMLHQRGYSYKDISDKNVFFNPNTGDVLICDNDNVSGNGMADSGVYGTIDFMAPEIVRGEAMPSKDTDLYSLAVLIFEMLFISHPLNGMNEYKIHALDENARKALYGTHPVFIFDPNNAENRPVPGWHDNAIIYWDLYPQFLKDKFIVAFSDGIGNVSKRIFEKEWKDISIRLLDSILICPNCGAEVFLDEAKSASGKEHICWGCQKKVIIPPSIRIGKNKILLSPKTKLKSHHINLDYDLINCVASVSQNPNNPAQWGLKNESNDTWTYIKADGSQVLVPPGKNAAIVSGNKINFGKVIGEI